MRIGRKWVWLAASALPLIVVGIVWAQRTPIAQSMIDDELAKRKVPARYVIKRLGTKQQRIENIVVGDPAHPDLTADWAEIDTSLRFSGATVTAIRAGGVRLHGRLADGVLSFGAVDRLLPAPTGKPFALPSLDIALSDSTLALTTPWGPVGAFVEGRGDLANAFKGQVALSAPEVAASGVSLGGGSGVFDLAIKNRRIALDGPVELGSIKASGVALGASRLVLSAQSDERFSDVALSAHGDGQVSALPFGSAETYRIEMNAARGPAKAGTANGRVWIDGVRPTRAESARLLATVQGGKGTPAEPLIDKFRAALAGLTRGSRAELAFACLGSGECRIAPERLVSTSGARLTGGGEGFAYSRAAGLAHQGRYSLSGGGFPDATVDLALAKGIWRASLVTKAYSAGGSRLALTPVRIVAGPKGGSFDTVATLDGPFGTGRVTGLRAVIAGRGGRSPLSGCMAPRFDGFEMAGLRLAPATVQTCFAGDEVRVAAPRLSGTLGKSKVQLAADTARIALERNAFELTGLRIQLNGEAQPTQLTVNSFTGTLAASGAAGRYSGASGKIGAVPLLMSEGTGSWSLASGTFTTAASLRVADAQPEYRFNPLISDDFALRFAGDAITATGTLKYPKSGIRVASVDIVHQLAPGTGRATLDVNQLTFGAALQPEELTPITLGVIANVSGAVNGQGIIDWTPQGVKSRGSFRTSNTDLAAAFGPVTGLTGEIALSDLLGLETPPGQSVSISSINPGFAVLNGEVKYRLLPGLKAQIEAARWPFAGGFLILEPTLLDLSAKADRRLTFRVEGVDAARFITQLEFDDIAASGIFDGTLPMVFDATGGRIDGGKLTARAGGGTLAYIGDISNDRLSGMGRFAFDALKSIKYDRLTIELGGPLDGDVVTRISFNGINQAPIGGVRAKMPIPIKVTGLKGFPFKFNVTISAPFRRLFDMSRTLNDPSLLIERLNPNLQRVGPAKILPNKPIQPPESETMR